MSLVSLSQKILSAGMSISASFLFSVEQVYPVTEIASSNQQIKLSTNLDSSLQLLAQNTENQRRIALVIGNANYQNGKLNNPANDANDMAVALEDLGFEVMKLVDADLRQMEEAVEQLSSKLQQGGVGLFYYAGHGVQVEGENYLIPLRASINRVQDVRYEAFPVGKVLGMMEDAENNVNIAILDACRNNPYTRQWRSNSQGLAAMQSTMGTLIAYATKPGGLTEDGGGRNGTYTSHLLEHIRTPNLDVELLFKRVRQGVIQETNREQIPWESSSLIGSFSFNAEVEDSTLPLVATVSETNNDSEAKIPVRNASEIDNSALENNNIAYNSNPSYFLQRTLEGHSDSVRSLAISPNGQRIVSSSEDNTIKVWNLITGELENNIQGNSESILSVAISPDGKRIVSGSWDNTIKVWNLTTGELERTFEGHSGSVRSVAISPDGQRIVSGSAVKIMAGNPDNTIKVWNLTTGKLERTLEGHSYAVESVAISPDGHHIVSSGEDATIKVWNLATGELKRTIKGHSHSVSSVAISPDGQHVVSGSEDKTIKIWNLATGELENTLKGHSNLVESVAISPDGQRIVSGSYDNTIKVWNLTTGSLEYTLEGHLSLVWSVAISPDGKHIVSSSGNSFAENPDYSIKVWQLTPQ